MDSEADLLAQLEARIQQAIGLVTQLRREKEAALAERDQALKEAAEAKSLALRLSQELEALKQQRSEIRARVEKLIAQIDSVQAG